MTLVPVDHQEHVHARLESDLIAWFTTVRPDGTPDTVPIWFAWSDGVLVVYSQPDKPKLRNLAANARVSLALDDTAGGDDVVRFEATARVAPDHPSADRLTAYVEKYSPHIERLGYGDPAAFAAIFSVPVVVTPTRYRRWA